MGLFDFFTKTRQAQPLFFATDIHSHIVPGIDDGAPDLAASMSLLESMRRWGLRRVFASPHITVGSFENTSSTISEAFEPLRAEAAERFDDLHLAYSAENRVDELFLKNFAEGDLLTLPGNFVLIENSYIQEPWSLDQIIFDMQVKGYRPILAHPERYAYYHKRDRYTALHSAGAAFQVNLLSLAGYYGKVEKKVAEELIEKGMVDYLGTDIHRESHARAISTYLASRDYERHRSALEGRLKNDLI